MELDPQIPPYRNSDPNSFASVSAQKRWPIIITQALDDVHRSLVLNKNGDAEVEGKAIIESISKLKYELQHNRGMTPLPDDGQSDIQNYNEELQQRGNPKWHDVAWLFSECYLYRRLATFFTQSNHWRNYDVFLRQKMSALKSSRPAVMELAARYQLLMTELSEGTAKEMSAEQSEAAESTLFTEMCEICLWGNATDLSLRPNLTYEDTQKLQGSEARKAAESSIVVNDIPIAFASLRTTKQEKQNGERRVDIVLDNAGFELFADLILAGYLLSSGLATVIVLHPKSIPWFVSDVIPQDFVQLLNALRDPESFFSEPSVDHPVTPELTEDEKKNLFFLYDNWNQLYTEGKIIIRPNRFWTEAGSYWRMPTVAPQLYEDLRTSDLVIFKGDLNGRKLTGDVAWDPTTPFVEAIGPLAKKGSGLRVFQLRTCKADVVVGLPPGKDEELRHTKDGGGDTGARKWAWTGEWAVVQFHDGL